MNRVPGFSPLAEYIAVIGPRAVDGPAKVLGVFPDVGSMDEHAVPLPAGLEIFVLPAGCACVRAASPPPPRLFMVVLAASSAKLFVYCLLVHEALLGRDDDATEQPSATPHAATTPLPRSQPHARDWAPRCVAIISRHASSSPARYLEALLAQLEKIPLAEPPSIRRGDRRKTRRARKALVQASGKGSNSHFDAPVPASCPPEAEPGRLVDHFLFRTLRQQLGGVLPPEVPLPIDGSRVLVSCGDRQLSLSIHPRIHPSVSTNPLSPRYPGLGDRLPPPAFHPAALLARAPAEALCVLLECLLCEMTVVLVSDSAAVLSAAAEALSALLRPFAWQGAYVPVLPESLVDIVWAPVPALVGVLGALFDESVAPDLGIHPAEEASSPGSNSRAGSSLSATLPLLPPLGEGEALLPLVVDLRAGRRLLHGHAPPARLPDRIRAAIATAARAFERAAPLRLVASDVLELPLPQGRRRGGEEGGAPVRSCALLQLLLEADGSARAAGLATVVAAQLEALLPGVRKWARGSLRQLTDGVFNAAAFAETLPAGPQRAFVRELSATQLFARLASDLALAPAERPTPSTPSSPLLGAAAQGGGSTGQGGKEAGRGEEVDDSGGGGKEGEVTRFADFAASAPKPPRGANSTLEGFLQAFRGGFFSTKPPAVVTITALALANSTNASGSTGEDGRAQCVGNFGNSCSSLSCSSSGLGDATDSVGTERGGSGSGGVCAGGGGGDGGSFSGSCSSNTNGAEQAVGRVSSDAKGSLAPAVHSARTPWVAARARSLPFLSESLPFLSESLPFLNESLPGPTPPPRAAALAASVSKLSASMPASFLNPSAPSWFSAAAFSNIGRSSPDTEAEARTAAISASELEAVESTELELVAAALVSAFEHATHRAVLSFALQLHARAAASRQAHERLLAPTTARLRSAVGSFTTAAIACGRAPAGGAARRAGKFGTSAGTVGSARGATTWPPSPLSGGLGGDAPGGFGGDAQGGFGGDAQGGFGGDSGSSLQLQVAKMNLQASQILLWESGPLPTNPHSRGGGAAADGASGTPFVPPFVPPSLPPSHPPSLRTTVSEGASPPPPLLSSLFAPYARGGDGTATLGGGADGAGMTLGGWRVRGGAGQPLEMAEARAEFENAVHHALVELRDAAQFVNAQIPSSQLGPPPSAAGGAASSSARAPSPPASSDGEVVGACVLGALVDNACTPPLEALIDALAAAIGRSATPPPRGVLRAVSLASEGLHAALEAGAWHVREACEVHAAERWAQLAATRSAVERELFARSSAGGSTPELLAFVARQEAHAELRGALATFVHAPIAAAVDEGAREGAALIGVLGALASKAQHELLTTAALPPDTPEAAPIGAREAARRLSQEAEEAEAEEGWAHAQAANWEVWEGN